MNAVKFRVIDCVKHSDKLLVSCELIEGEISLGTLLTVKGKQGNWRVSGLSFVSVESHQEGRRGISLEASQGAQNIEQGDEMASAEKSIGENQ